MSVSYSCLSLRNRKVHTSFVEVTPFILECIYYSYRELSILNFTGDAEEWQRKKDLILSYYNLTVIQSRTQNKQLHTLM